MTEQPSYAPDAELSLLGAAMSGYPDLDELLETVAPADFYSPFHEEVWDAIGRVHRAGNKPDAISVRLALSAAQVRYDPLKLADMVASTPLIRSAPYYATQVLEMSGLRKLQMAGLKVQQLGASIGGDLEDLRERARAAVDEATEGRVATAARSLGQILPEVLDIAQNGTSAVLPTGWPDVDRILGGLAPGRLVVVGARPGVGKSLMGANLALHFAHFHKHAVLFASLEMNEHEVTQRMLANHAKANLTSLATGKTTDEEWDRIAAKQAELDVMPIRVVDASSQTVTSIRREARNYQRVRQDLALIIVDYLQLMTVTQTKNGNRVEALGEVSRGLKNLARETGACVVAMAQVNRQSTNRTDMRPRQSDLRESGSIEADADQVILLHQPDDEVPELEVIIDKNRHGIRGTAMLSIHGHYARLVSVGYQGRKELNR